MIDGEYSNGVYFPLFSTSLPLFASLEREPSIEKKNLAKAESVFRFLESPVVRSKSSIKFRSLLESLTAIG